VVDDEIGSWRGGRKRRGEGKEEWQWIFGRSFLCGGLFYFVFLLEVSLYEGTGAYGWKRRGGDGIGVYVS
jgi:hypothetical protein